MKNYKIVTVLLCVCMLLSVCACGKKEDGSKEEGQTVGNVEEDKQNEQSKPEKEDGETSDKESGDKNTDNSSGLPLCEKKEELGVWLAWSNSFITDPNELFSVAELENRTNVHINWTAVNPGEASEKFGLMIASGDYPDIIVNGNNYYTGGSSAAVDDGIFIELDEVVANYMPNYNAILHSDDEVVKKSTDDSGKIDIIWQYATVNGTLQGEPVFLGYCIRQDWLDDLGMEVPVTIEDWHNVLTAFKEKKGCESPLSIPYNAANIRYQAFLNAYGVVPEYYQIDGQVHFGPMEEGYKEWLDLFRSWYAEGLIDPNFSTNTGFVTDHDVIALGKCGAGFIGDSDTGDMMLRNGYTQEEDFWLTATPSPVLNEGDIVRSTFPGREYLDYSLNITSNCKNVELAAKWLDYQYSKEGMILMNYGIENDSYYLDENGEPQWTEKILNGFDGLTPKDSQNMYTLGYCVTGLYCWDTNRKITPDANTGVAADTWSTDLTDWTISSAVLLTDEEQKTFNTYNTDITTLVDEFTVKYIMGVAAEEEYDSFISNLKQYGVEKCIELKQTALDRFNSK